MSLPEPSGHAFDPADGLDIIEVAILAVVNNPDLRVVRDDANVAHAQAFGAGLLPNPQLSLTRDFPISADSALISAYTLGLSYDITALITRGATVSAARADSRKSDLTLLWQEWQVVSQARKLFVDTRQQERALALLTAQRDLFAQRYETMRRALEQGNTTIDAVSPLLTALQDAQRQLHDAQRQAVQTRHDLNALLGLAPDAQYALVGESQRPLLDVDKVHAAMADLPRRRPDLLALEAGYEAGDQRYRQAILAQFPALTLGVQRARDTSDINTRGFTVGVSLPLFNRNQGNIAIEKATRERLYDEYHARLVAAYSDADRVLASYRLLEEQARNTAAGIAALEQAAANAQTGYDLGLIDALNYTNLQSALIAKQLEALTIEQTMLEEGVALRTLIGGGIDQLPMEKP